MNEEKLYHRLLLDLNILGLPIEEVKIIIRPFSKTYYGRYFPKCNKRKEPKIFLYPYENTEGKFLNYDKILETAIHEFVHHIQHSNPNFKRIKGVMHNSQFWNLYNHYIKQAEIMKLWR